MESQKCTYSFLSRLALPGLMLLIMTAGTLSADILAISVDFGGGLAFGSALALAPVASADIMYDVSGTFGTTGFTGPLNGGTFQGTFSATLPITSGTETITTYDIELLTSSHTVLTTLTGVSADVSVQSSNCDLGNGTTTGPCYLFDFLGSDGSALQLATPLGFTGGSVFANSGTPGANGSLGVYKSNSSSNDSIVSSGSITPAAVPEPASLLLFAPVALAALRKMSRGRRNPQRSRCP